VQLYWGIDTEFRMFVDVRGFKELNFLLSQWLSKLSLYEILSKLEILLDSIKDFDVNEFSTHIALYVINHNDLLISESLGKLIKQGIVISSLFL
jgi:hypothetical protein